MRLALRVWPGKLGCQLSPGPSDAAPTGSDKVKISRTGFLNKPRVINLKQGTDKEEVKLSLYPPPPVPAYRHPSCTYQSD